jgi:hypothetical protein
MSLGINQYGESFPTTPSIEQSFFEIEIDELFIFITQESSSDLTITATEINEVFQNTTQDFESDLVDSAMEFNDRFSIFSQVSERDPTVLAIGFDDSTLPSTDVDPTPDPTCSSATNFTQTDISCSSPKTTQIPPSNLLSQLDLSRPRCLHKLPNEILGNIFRHELQNTQGVPNLLLALAADKDPSTGTRSRFYDIAQYHHQACNVKVTPKNFKDFRKQTWDVVSKYDHIEIVAPVDMNANKVTWKNNFETIAFDLRKLDRDNNSRWFASTQAGWLIAASSSARQLVLKDKIGRGADIAGAKENDFRKDSHAITVKLGIKPKLKVTSEGLQCWIWEREDGGKLSWNWHC